MLDSFRQWNFRLVIFYAIYLFLFLIITGGLAWHQLFQHDYYTQKQEQQNQRRILYPAPRGKIYDRSGHLLVGNQPRYSAVIYLNDIKKEITKVRRKLYEEIKQTRPDLTPRKRFNNAAWGSRMIVLQRYLDEINNILGTQKEIDLKALKRHYELRLLLPFPLESDLHPDEYAKIIEQLPIGSPIFIRTEAVRHYPYDSLAAHTLGYVSTPRKQEAKNMGITVPGKNLKTYKYKGKIGRNGLEKSFESTLAGESGGEVWIVDPMQYQFKPIDHKSQLPLPGNDIVTSIDITLQKATEHAIGSKTGVAIAVEIATGRVLALASKPDYDLNETTPKIYQKTYNKITDSKAWEHRGIRGLYPPGSTFKMLTAIAAMRNGLLDETELISCGTHYRVSNRAFPEHSSKAFGDIDLIAALEGSSNVYFYQVGLNTGIDNISAEMKRFGFGQPTGIELPGEKKGLIPTQAWKEKQHHMDWFKGDTANISIGQGYMLVTPIQMVQFTASLARRETRTQLTLMQDVKQPVEHGGEPIGLTDAQYTTIIEGMRRVIESDKGTGNWMKRIGNPENYAAIKHISIAGKTGTAQVRPYGKKLTLAWFLGFAPIESPQIAIVVMIEGMDEDDNYAGGKTAVPIAQKIFNTYFSAAPENVAYRH